LLFFFAVLLPFVVNKDYQYEVVPAMSQPHGAGTGRLKRCLS